MPALLPDAWLRRSLAEDAAANLIRRPRARSGGSRPLARIDDREVLVLCSNDYLGLSVHPAVREAAARAACDLGVGSTGSRHLSGCHRSIEELEVELCAFEGAPAATMAPTGYAANLATLQAVGGPDAVVFSDAANHASIIDGCRLARTAVEIYRHLDLDDLEQRLRRSAGRPVIVSDSVFSMEGDVADAAGLMRLAHEHGAWLILDEAHATGVLGPGGRGAAAAAGLAGDDEQLIRVVTFSKALGASGGAVCSSSGFRQLLLQRGRALIFSTAPTLPSVAAVRAALEVLQGQPELVDRLGANARVLRGALGPLVLPGAASMPIAAVVLGEAARALAAEERLVEAGFLVQAIRPPTVPVGGSRLRLTASALHEEAQLQAAASAVHAAVAEAGVAPP